MQGTKIFQEKLFNQFRLSERVPEHNFYRRLKEVLDLEFLYKLTRPYYGDSGQKSIDPVVFFKLCLVGYLENITSDRKLIPHCSMRLDILYFLGYDIDEELPWHSTISRTRQLFPEAVFESVFTKIFELCVSAGMVAGHTQTIDSAPVKANASMDTLELKVPEEDLEGHLREIRNISHRDKQKPLRQSKANKADKAQQTLSASTKELQAIKSRNAKWAKDQDARPGAGAKGSRYTSNKTHYSPTDPDARISVKPGKARKLNYLSQLTVDTANHVISDIKAYHADGKDSQHLPDIVKRVKQRLWKTALVWENCVADTGYSSGENYAFLEAIGLKSFIPAHGTYKGGPDGFTYHEKEDYYTCPQGQIIPFKKVFIEKKNNTKKKEYRGSKPLCLDCPVRTACLGKTAQEKKFTVTYYRSEYERNIARVESSQGRYMKGKRQSTVEPVFGTLTQFMGLRKVNTIGIEQANKCMQLSAIAYNLKKYMKFIEKRTKSGAGAQALYFSLKNTFYNLINMLLKPFKTPGFLSL
ncbi:DDE transposase [Seonamhaeicola sp. S2-3]|uniref:IS1182 family transposase n=1 Tax=Seonamhaeicola sp. S2-3 TaxID=1936081 RepID=UPI000972A54D|nr:IS1182 family transposase [Seonamhaeicola sp. S2-3]APY12141.1 DDE transposase [Seonamhaeicola sp. S2-3]APY12146.1 DDE transposase [Seonamhaeicola sp. S2-3]